MCRPSLLTALVWLASAVNVERKVYPTSIAYEVFHPPPIPASPALLKPTFLHLAISTVRSPWCENEASL
jgi:hypothetical protein